VRTAIAWLEEAKLLTREENQVQIFPSSLRVTSLKEAQEKISRREMRADYQRQLLALVDALISADADEGISTDELMGAAGLSAEKVRAALYDLEKLGIASNDTALTAYVHAGVANSSRHRFDQVADMEEALIAELRLSAPDLGKGDSSVLHLRHAAQHLKDAGHAQVLPGQISQLLKSLAKDGRNEASSTGSLRLKKLDAETVHVTLQRDWAALEKTAQLRRTAANLLLAHLLNCLPHGQRGTDLLAETTLGKLTAAIESDLALMAEIKEPAKLLDLALLWLHEQEIIRLNKGMAIFRPAMTILLEQEKRGFAKAEFAPLVLHYAEQIIQIHVMAEYAQLGLKAMADALRLAMSYFSLDRDAFLKLWLPGRAKELAQQTTPASWRAIVESLNNPIQQRIVADDREQTNVLVLAGPGSGKTRVLVHRITYLVRARRENPHGILALAYNRHAAVEIRRRLADLIGDDARGVTILTCHAFAMRLVGASFMGRANQVDGDAFKAIMQEAVALLKGAGLPPEEADEQRDRLLAGFRRILVDEYQDVGPDQYELISALAGRTQTDAEGKLTLFAVGDDDQNIYAFSGASVEFIRRFEADYSAKPAFLTENYRSTGHIIAAANQAINSAANRMKTGHPISIDRARSKEHAGGAWQTLDPVAQGRVQILPAGDTVMTQAMAVMAELERLARLVPAWDWTKAAIVAREWKYLEPLRSYCEMHQIPVQMADEETTQFWRLRETQVLATWLRGKEIRLVDAGALRKWLDEQPEGPWWSLLREAVEEYAIETGEAELPRDHFLNWLAEWGREVRRRQTGLMLLTAHRAKGLEFDHVAVLDGGWDKFSKGEDPDAPRRLYYVAMTRARQTLTLARMADRKNKMLDTLSDNPAILYRSPAELQNPPVELALRYVQPTLKMVDLGFAGCYTSNNPIHQTIANLTAGDPLLLRECERHWELSDNNGNTIGRMSKKSKEKFSIPAGTQFLSGRVAAIIAWRRADTKAEYLDRVRCDRWEVVVPELVFAPLS
jgi:ATP-dependent DNA helicase RecQ